MAQREIHKEAKWVLAVSVYSFDVLGKVQWDESSWEMCKKDPSLLQKWGMESTSAVKLVHLIQRGEDFWFQEPWW